MVCLVAFDFCKVLPFSAVNPVTTLNLQVFFGAWIPLPIQVVGVSNPVLFKPFPHTPVPGNFTPFLGRSREPQGWFFFHGQDPLEEIPALLFLTEIS